MGSNVNWHWEYGWISKFDNGEEYEWDRCESEEDMRARIARYEEEEGELGYPDSLTYHPVRRRVYTPGAWEPLDEQAD